MYMHHPSIIGKLVYATYILPILHVDGNDHDNHINILQFLFFFFSSWK